MTSPAGAPSRSWLPAVVGGHAIVTTSMLMAALLLLAVGTRGDDAVHPAWSVAWGVGAVAVLVLAVRWIGAREWTRRARWWAGTGASVLVPLTWAAAYFASFSPWLFAEAWLTLLVLGSPVWLVLALAGGVATGVLVTRR